MFELLYSSGLRVSELTGLDIHSVRQSGYTSTGSIDLNEKEVTVTGEGKQNTNRSGWRRRCRCH